MPLDERRQSRIGGRPGPCRRCSPSRTRICARGARTASSTACASVAATARHVRLRRLGRLDDRQRAAAARRSPGVRCARDDAPEPRALERVLQGARRTPRSAPRAHDRRFGCTADADSPPARARSPAARAPGCAPPDRRATRRHSRSCTSRKRWFTARNVTFERRLDRPHASGRQTPSCS